MPGDRVCVAVSGGADSTALLRALLARREGLGIVLSVVHVEHGLRGEAAHVDRQFVADLAEKLSLSCDIVAVDTRKRAAERKETIEEAARNLRYQVFRELLKAGKADKIATAHTLDDQAETVLMKFLRGAWTEGLSGIHPALRLQDRPTGCSRDAFDCVRPFLSTRRCEIENYLRLLGQPWRDDETNRSVAYTRNRIRHELLPQLREFNPRIDEALAHLAANARAEESHWLAELARVLPRVLLPGKPVRGGGRSVETSPGANTVAVDLARLRGLDEGLQRRLLREAVKQCGGSADFFDTERLMELAGLATREPAVATPRRLELAGGIRVARTLRELQFTVTSSRNTTVAREISPDDALPVYVVPVPGSVDAPALGARFSVTAASTGQASALGSPGSGFPQTILVRAWLPGDTVELAHSGGTKKVKEVLQRMGVRGEERKLWPVAVWNGRIVWMRGAAVTAPRDESGPGSGWIFNVIETALPASNNPQ